MSRIVLCGAVNGVEALHVEALHVGRFIFGVFLLEELGDIRGNYAGI